MPNLPVTPQGLQDDLANTNRICTDRWSMCKARAREYREACIRERQAVTESDRRFYRNRRHNISSDFDQSAGFLKIYRAHRHEIYAALAEWDARRAA